MRVTFLGTGTSRGIPVIGCDCKVCLSDNPKNHRLRSSLLIQGTVTLVIDTSVDFRVQMLRYGVRHLDALLYTHSHVDHILGLDDVYPFNMWSERTLPAYGSEATLKEIAVTFRHLFDGKGYPGVPSVELIPVAGRFRVGDLEIEPIDLMHGRMPVLGFRIGRFAYLTDVSYIPEVSFERLRGVECLVLDGLRYQSHPTHFSLPEAVEAAARIGPERTYLVHICHEVDHDEGNAYLPDAVSLAHDGLVLEV